MRMKPGIFILIFLAISLASSAEARPSDDGACKIYKQLSKDVPASAKPIFQTGGILLVCKSPGVTAPRYYMRKQPWKGRSNVCHFEEQELFAFITLDDQTVLLEQPDLGHEPLRIDSYMMVTEGPCPSADDARYAPTSSVSEGVFSGLMGLLNQLGESAESFEKTCFLHSPKERERFTYADLEKIVKPNGAIIRSARLFGTESRDQGPAPYQLILSDPKDEFKFIVISADETEAGLCVTAINRGIE